MAEEVPSTPPRRPAKGHVIIPMASRGVNKQATSAGMNYNASTLRYGDEADGHSRAMLSRFDSELPCERCGNPILQGQWIRFHDEYFRAIHDGCSSARDPNAPAEHGYVIKGARKPKLCKKCWLEHAGEECL